MYRNMTEEEQKMYPIIESLSDEMTMKWVKENWEQVTRLYELNVNGSEIINMYHYGKSLQKNVHLK